MATISFHHAEYFLVQNCIQEWLSWVQTEAARLFEIEKAQLVGIVQYVFMTDETVEIQHVQSQFLSYFYLSFSQFFRWEYTVYWPEAPTDGRTDYDTLAVQTEYSVFSYTRCVVRL